MNSNEKNIYIYIYIYMEVMFYVVVVSKLYNILIVHLVLQNKIQIFYCL